MAELYDEIKNEYHYPTFMTTVDRSYECLKERKDDGRYERLKENNAMESNQEIKKEENDYYKLEKDEKESYKLERDEKESIKLVEHGTSIKTWIAFIMCVVFMCGFVTMTSLFVIQLNTGNMGSTSIQENQEKVIEPNQQILSLQRQISRLKNIIISPHLSYSYGNSTYILFTTRMTWNDSQLWCFDTGGKLAEIETEDENTFIRNSIISARSANKITDGVWVGGTDQETEGVWKWASTNTNINFTFWAQGEPNDFRGNEDCLEFAEDKGWWWNDNNCEATMSFLCEILQNK